jgi:hypothetical protein
MKLKVIRIFILSFICLISVNLSAQDEYRAEIGINGGGSYYLGDANSQLFKNMQLAYGGFFRFNYDPRIAVKAELTSTQVQGTGFNNHVFAIDMTGEFNFFDLEKKENALNSKIFSPYIFAGMGMMNYKYPDLKGINRLLLNPSIPFGLGMKVKLGPRWNLNMQWTTRLLLADDLEGTVSLKNPNWLNGSNPFNNDILSSITIGISYNIWKKICDCKNSSIYQGGFKLTK